LVAFLDHATASGFIPPQNRAMLLVGTDPDDLLDRIALYEPPETKPWVGSRDT
jgi:predicted Rossmann-fold nucleotide-binding protein